MTGRTIQTIVGLIFDALIVGGCLALVVQSRRNMVKARRWAWIARASQIRAQRAARRAAQARSRTAQLRGEVADIVMAAAAERARR